MSYVVVHGYGSPVRWSATRPLTAAEIRRRAGAKPGDVRTAQQALVAAGIGFVVGAALGAALAGSSPSAGRRRGSTKRRTRARTRTR